jgi:hypothetical protein
MTGRSTRDIVLLIFAATVGLVLVLAVAGVLLVELLHPDVDTSVAVTGVTHTLGVIVGVTVGFMLGKGKREEP